MAPKVSVRDVQRRTLRSGGTSYVVKWRVPGPVGERSRSFGVKAPAERLQRQLKLAADDPATRWDAQTGLPAELVAAGAGLFVHHVTDFVRRQASLRPTSVKSLHDGLSLAALVFTAPPRGGFTVAQVRAMRVYLLDALSPQSAVAADSDKHAEARRLLRRHSLPLAVCAEPARIDELNRVLHLKLADELSLAPSARRAEAVARLADEPATLTTAERVARNAYIRRRNAVNALFNEAVLRGELDRNPLAQIRRARRGEGTVRARQVQANTVATPEQVRLLAAAVAVLGRGTGFYYTLVLVLGLAGLRPSEAYHLRLADLDLEVPDTGWGTIWVSGGTPRAGRRYTGAEPYTDEAIKTASDDDARRPVPIPPELVSALRLHLELFRAGAGWQDRVFVNGRGNPIDQGNFERLFRSARERVFQPASPLRTVTPYELRHTSVSTLLRAGVPIVEVARRHGHSPDVLLRIYAGLIPGEAEASNQRVEALLRGTWTT